MTLPGLRGMLAMLLSLSGALAATAASAAPPATPAIAADAAAPRITVLYDAFGDDPALRRDWGFASLVEAGGRRILFDTGNDAEVFAHNVAAKGVDLASLDAVVMSHRHSDHMAGLGVVLAANPGVTIHAPQEGFGIYGSSLPSTFYRKAPELPARMRYYGGEPPETMVFGSAWPGSKFKPLAKTTEIADGVWVIAQVSDQPGTRELRELSLAIETPEGLVLVVGCSHPGIAAIVKEAATISPTIRLVIGGFHYVNADDAAIATLVQDLRAHDIAYIAPGHCTGEATFAALQAAFGDRYLYAGAGAVVDLGEPGRPALPGAAAFDDTQRAAYAAQAAAGHHDHGHDHGNGTAGVTMAVAAAAD